MALSGDWMNAALTFSHSVGSMKFLGVDKNLSFFLLS